jgi:hypothetical protein
MTSIVLPLATGIDLTAPPTNIGTTTPPAITVSTLFRSANSGNIPFVAQPSGTGAFQLQPTNSTATGGNARGANAVDLQTARTAAFQVASGDSSFLFGRRSVSSGDGAICIGDDSNASQAGSIAIGNFINATGQYSFGAGQSINVSGYASVGMGIGNNSNGAVSIALGRYSLAKGISDILVLGNPVSTVAGSGQTSILPLGTITTDATPTILSSDTVAPSASNQLVLQNNSALYVEGLVIANVTGAGNTSSWKIAATIKRGANAASTVLVGTPTITMAHQDAGASTWVVAIIADTTNGCLAVTVTGQASTTIRWVCTLFASEVAF